MSAPQITIYSDSNYQGSSSSLGTGSYNGGFGLRNDSLSSVKMPSALKVRMFKEGNFQGSCMVCVRDTSFVGKSVNDQISSIIVEPLGTPTVIIYSDPRSHRGRQGADAG